MQWDTRPETYQVLLTPRDLYTSNQTYDGMDRADGYGPQILRVICRSDELYINKVFGITK